MNIQPNNQYALVLPEITKNRDCVAGSFQIKGKKTEYLVHPGIYDYSSLAESVRYSAYLHGAEFHEFPGETLSSLLGKLSFGETHVDFPDGLNYLIENSDGDGMSLSGLMECTASNVLQVKYHVLLVDLPNTLGIDPNNLSRADSRGMNLQAYIKQYTRESLIDWQFSMYDKVNQLTLLVFCETKQVRGDDLSIIEEKSYLVCGLDEIGYYQQKFTDNKGNIEKTVDKIYPKVNGKVLRWIPCEIVSDEELPSGSLPLSSGYLAPICNAALARYRVSADYKEALRNGVPTLFTNGWTDGDSDLFKTINGGRESVVTGAGVVNNLPNNVSVSVEGVSLNDSAFMNYFDSNAKLARAMGAKFSDTEVVAATATEANINAGNNNAVLEKLAMNIESAFRRAALYCGMFNGLWGQENIESNLDSIQLDIPKEFNSVKMTPQEALAVKDLYQSGLMSLETAITKLVQGGFSPIDAEEELGRIERQGPLPSQSIDTTQNNV